MLSAAKMNDEDIKTRLEQKFRYCYAKHKAVWLTMSPNELIEHAEKIATDKWLVDTFPDFVPGRFARFLLRFSDPLEIVRNAWLLDSGYDWVFSDEVMLNVLWKLVDRYSTEYDCELEDEQVDNDERMGMSDIS